MDSKITLYKNPSYEGRSKEFTESCPDLLDAGFDKITSSVKCEKGMWILYSEKNYKGQIYVILEGEDYSEKFAKYFNDTASSLKLLDNFDFTEVPECTIYKNSDYSGRSLTFTDDVENLEWYKFDNKMSSIVVKSGAWVGYRAPRYRNEQSLFLKGSYNIPGNPNDEGGFCLESMSSFRKMVKPAGQLKLKSIDYDLKKNQMLKTPSTVFSWAQVNNTSVEQTLTLTDKQSLETEDTYEFRWDNASKISGTITANVSIPFGGSFGVSLSKEKSVSMGKNKGTNVSKTDTWVAEYPSKIPPYSTVTVTSQLTKGKTNIPFTAILYHGDDIENTIAEKGVFYGCNFFDFHTEFNETKLSKPT